MITGRYDHGCALLSDGRVVVSGGNDIAVTLRSTEYFSFLSLTWEAGPDLPVKLSESKMATLGEWTLSIGGSTPGFTWWKRVYRLNPAKSSWTEIGKVNSDKTFFDVLPISVDECEGW